MKHIKVLVVDDSALMRRIISDMIKSDEDMEVIDTARNGADLFKKLDKVLPDVITLDVEMPVMNGLEVLRELKRKNIQIPVIVISSVSTSDASSTIECLEAGAFDFIAKPSGQISLDIDKIKGDLLSKIRLAYCESSNCPECIETKKSNSSIKSKDRSINLSKKKLDAVVIGASTGGPRALYSVITALPGDLGVPIFVVQHMPAGFTKAFADRLNSNSDLNVCEATQGQEIKKNHIYIAPGGYHMQIDKSKRIELNKEPTIWGVRPAVDKLFISASEVYGSALLSVVLTGMGRDGANGTIEVKKNGGITISEHESTCTIYGMPKAAYETGMVDEVLPLNEIPVEIVRLLMN